MLSTIHLHKKPEEMSKQELVDTMNYLQPKVDSGRTTGAEVAILKECCDVYMRKYDMSVTCEYCKNTFDAEELGLVCIPEHWYCGEWCYKQDGGEL